MLSCCSGAALRSICETTARLLALVREFDAADKWIFALCHGVQILAAAGLTTGKCLTCYEHVRLEVEHAGGKFVTEQVVRDGRIITGQTWQSHPDFYREIFALLGRTNRTGPGYSSGPVDSNARCLYYRHARQLGACK